MEIIKATILDLSALRKLELECFGKDAWPLFDLIAVLTFAEVIRIKAIEDGQMVGFIAGDRIRATGGAGSRPWQWIHATSGAGLGAHYCMLVKVSLASPSPV